MAKVLTDSKHYTDIANAIRSKNGSSETYTPAQMATAIESIKSGGSSYFDQIQDGAGAHNAVYRGKDLGSAVTNAQWNAIKDGTFRNLYIGDYWTINGVTYRIAAFDYYYNTGDEPCTNHHVTLVPDDSMYSHAMNDSNVTTGGYVGSKMYTTGLVDAKTTINNSFGSDHILTHRQYLCNSVSNGKPSGGSWYDSTVELMTEQNVYGSKLFGAGNNGSTVPALHTVDKSQYPLFNFRPDMISNRNFLWLRDVASGARFADVHSGGYAAHDNASVFFGVRPSFSICNLSSTSRPEIVSWADGTDEQIAAMVAALEDGTISVEDTGWAVGDKRTVQLGEMAATGISVHQETQTVEFVLSHLGATNGVTRADGKPIHFQVDQVNSLNNPSYMNTTNTNSGSWNGCGCRTWCNETYYAAIPKALRPIFKQMKVKTAETYNGSTLKESEDFFAFRAEKEIFGDRRLSNPTEAAALEQIEWYKTIDNRKKLRNGSTSSWWERSLFANDSTEFCRVYLDGSANYAPAANGYGLAPFGCI